MPQIDLLIDFMNLENISKERQSIVADYLMMRKDIDAFDIGFTYFYTRMPDTFAIRFKQTVELVASKKHPGQFHCLIPNETLGMGSFATVCKSTRKFTLIPDPNNHGHFQFADPKLQPRAIKYTNLQSHKGNFEKASNAAIAEAKHMGMVAPVRLHPSLSTGKGHSETRLPRIIMTCYPETDLLTLSCQMLHSKDFSLQTKLDLSISALAKLMFLQQWLIHRDIKPQNMMVDHVDREITFVDFASALEVDKFIKDGKGIWGTTIFIAPERFNAQTCKNPKAIDTFSMGVVITQLFVTDKTLLQNVISHFLGHVCQDLYDNWDSSEGLYKNSPCRKRFKQKPNLETILIYVRSSLLTAFGTDVFQWNNVDDTFVYQLASVVGEELVLDVPRDYLPEEYSIPYKELDDDQRQELTKIIMGIVATEPSKRATANEALNDFVLFYSKKYYEQTEVLKYRIQKQLLMAAVDVAIQILKNEVYKKSFDELSSEEKPKIDCLRQILERLKQFKKQASNKSPEQASAISSNQPPVLSIDIGNLRQQASACFTTNEKVIATLSSNRSFQGKSINGASQLFGCFFSNGSNPLATSQSGRYLPKRFRVAEKALQIIEDANRMADNIFANVSAPRPQLSSG